MTQEEITKEIWDKHSERWAKAIKKINPLTPVELKKKEDEIFNFIYSLKNPKKILDAGCGTGEYSIHSALLGNNVVAVDYSEKNLEIARRFAKLSNVKIKFERADVRKLPFENESFDVVLSAGVIEHFPETREAIKEHIRVLKSKGYFIGNVPQRVTVFVLNKYLLKILKKWDVGYEKSFTMGQWKKYLQESGMNIIKFKQAQIVPGIRKPWYGKILRFLDKPLILIGFGGAHFYFIAQKK